jgi:hypothetical protein
MGMEIFSDGLALIPDLFHSVFFNAFWFIMAGERFPIKEHHKLRYVTRQALRLQKSIDTTGGALAQTPWIRYFAPSCSGFADFMEATKNILKFVQCEGPFFPGASLTVKFCSRAERIRNVRCWANVFPAHTHAYLET